MEGKKISMDIPRSDRNGKPKVLDPAFSAFFVQLPQKLRNCLKSQLKRLPKDNDGIKSVNPFFGKERASSAGLGIDLEKQLQAWRENPSWVNQPPEIKEVISRKVLVDEGQRQVVEVEQAALWRFLWWSGTISVHVLVDQNREDHSMKFKQLNTGFMKKFEGHWRVEPVFVDEKICFPFKPKTLAEYCSCTGGKGRIGSKASLDQLIQPAIVPPPPISWYLRGITAKTTEMLINDLLAEAARLTGGCDTENSNKELRLSEEISYHHHHQDEQIYDIKERWNLRRRNVKQHRKKLSTAESFTF
ncbi:uncharacterized protein LOC111317873 isoform X2 [Durio zibethinus]|uniref:Uncharacterized protein LOC111317873 isoform X2 n=1 Tax=Durio zibethinus TaxID=66656 RepID=A0A6P6BG69_DURZI|nr:uncharacterized protein LOC111317873 isoform X2 [Durio zibethinus]